MALRENPRQTARLKDQREHHRTAVVVKLNQLCKEKWFSSAIPQMVRKANEVLLEAYMFANFHLNRCCETHADRLDHFPVINQLFYQRCCASVCTYGKPLSFANDTPGDQFLWGSVKLWSFARQKHMPDLSVPDMSGLSHLVHTLAKQMETAALNHLVLTIGPRVLRWIQVAFKSDRGRAQQLLSHIFLAPDDVLTPRQAEVKALVKLYPSEANIEANMAHFIRVSWQILQRMEQHLEAAHLQNDKKGAKGCRLFSLLPLKGSFVMSHIPLTTTTLHEVLRWMKAKNLCPAALSPDADAQANFRSLFDFRNLETPLRTFADYITTNGCSASVIFKCKKSAAEIAQQEAQPRKKRRRAVKTKKGKGAPTKEGPQHGFLEEDFDQVIGCDPGQRFVFTAINQRGDLRQASLGEYRHRAKMNEQRRWNEQLKAKNRDYKAAIESLPSLKCSDSDLFLLRALLQLASRDFLLGFHTQGFLNLRF